MQLFFKRLSFVILGALSMSTFAESSSSEKDVWEVNWTPYIWAATLQADVEVGPVQGSQEVDFKDIVDKLDFAFMHYLEAHNGTWGVANEIIYFDLSDSQKQTGGPGLGPGAELKAEVDLTQTIFDLAATYRPTESKNTIITLGVRHIAVEADAAFTFSGPGPSPAPSLSLDEDWQNLLIGVNQLFPLNEKWLLAAKADVATDFGDELSYILTLGANWQMTDLLDLKFGYRYGAVEYENNNFVFEETVSGVFTGLTFKF